MIENGKYGLKCELCCLDNKPDICDKSLEERFCSPLWSERQLAQIKKAGRKPYNLISKKMSALVKKFSQEPFDPEVI